MNEQVSIFEEAPGILFLAWFGETSDTLSVVEELLAWLLASEGWAERGRHSAQADASGAGGLGGRGTRHWPPSLYFCLSFSLCPITSDSAPHWLRNVKTAKEEIKQKRKTRKRG